MRRSVFILIICLMASLGSAIAGGQDSEIAAKIGDEIIKRGDLEVRKKKVAAGPIEELATAKEMREDERRLLNEAIDLTLLAMEAKKAGLLNDLTLKAKIRYQVDLLIVQEYVNHYIDSLIPITENEILESYKTDPKYQQKVALRLSHILAKTEEEAKEILSRIRSGEDFSKVATERSRDPGSRETGGDMGWVVRGRLVKPLEEAAFALKEGEVSDVVKTVYGYHIIKLENRKTEPPVELKKARGEIVKELKVKKKKEFIEKKLLELKASVPIEILSEKYKN